MHRAYSNKGSKQGWMEGWEGKGTSKVDIQGHQEIRKQVSVGDDGKEKGR